MSEFFIKCAAQPLSLIGMFTALALTLIGLWCVLTQTHLFKIVMGFALVNTAGHLFLVVLGYIRGGMAPIWQPAVADRLVAGAVDPLPSALVLTAIVIGLGTSAVLLGVVVRMAREGKSLDIRSYRGLKW